MPSAVIYVITTQTETKTKQTEFLRFLTQLDCKLMYDNKNQTQLTLVWHIEFCFQNKTGMMENIAKLAKLLNFMLIRKVSERLRSC